MKRRRIVNIGAKVILATIFVFITGLFVLRSIIQKKIGRELTQLSPALQVKFSSVHVDIFSSSLSFDSLSINFTPYLDKPQNSHGMTFPTASLRQVNFLRFLLNKKLVTENLILDGGRIQLDQFLLEKNDSAQSGVLNKIQWPFKKALIRHLQLKSTSAFICTGGKSQSFANGDIFIHSLSIDEPGGTPSFRAVDLHLSDINYSTGGRKVHAEELTVNTNTRVVEIQSLKLFAEGGGDPTTISEIKATGLDTDGLINRKVLRAKEIMIGKSRFVMENMKKKESDALRFGLKTIQANVVQFEDASVLYRDRSNKCTLHAVVKLYALRVNLFGKNDFQFGSVEGNLSGIRYSGKGYHDINIKRIVLDDKRVEIDDIQVVPRVGKYEFGRKLHHQADWVRASIPKIEVSQPNIKQLFHKKLFAEKVTVSKSNVYVFRDRRLPRQQKFIPLPAEYLATLPVDLRIKVFELASSVITYEEYPREGYEQTGILRIERASAIISPLINHSVASDPPYITMQVKGSVMGSGTATGTIIMPLRMNKPYRVKGVFEKLELTKLNSSSENLGKIRIKSGFLDFLSFDFAMTEERSTGKIIGAYHHLVIQQLKKHTEEKNVADFASFMLRHLIIPLDKDKSMPEKKRTGLVNYQRDPTRFVSHYFLQSLLMGVKKSFALGFLLPK